MRDAKVKCPQCGEPLSADWANSDGEVWCRKCRAGVPLDHPEEPRVAGGDWAHALRPSARMVMPVSAQGDAVEHHPVPRASGRGRRILRWLFPESPSSAEVLPETAPENGSVIGKEETPPPAVEAGEIPAADETQANRVAGRLLADLTQARARAVWQERALVEARAHGEALAEIVGRLTADLNHERAECAQLAAALEQARLELEEVLQEAVCHSLEPVPDPSVSIRPEVIDARPDSSRDDLLGALMRFTSSKHNSGR